jgi:ABC-type transport system involved in cytochrome c biogenesis ATPase subunit
MTMPYCIDKLTFSDGTNMPVKPRAIIVIVGPNNSGKSRALRDIEMGIRNPEQERAVVTALSGEKAIDFDGFRTWLTDHGHVFRKGIQEFATRPHAGAQNMDWIRQRWNQGPPFRELTPFLVLQGNTEGRLGLATSVDTFNAMEERPSNPLQELYLNEELETNLSDASFEAFRMPLTVNRVAGKQIHLQVGRVDDVPGPREATNEPYLEALRDLPRIQEEGDGVRSYIGILLSSIASQFPVVLLDEPEAFLHPPQATQLGQKLVKLLPEDGGQIITASHSSDFLQGVLYQRSAAVTVVRLTRDHDVNHAAILGANELQKLWGDPILRYSSLLDGLFHRGVVLCEGDSDCRFYQATLEETLTRNSEPAHDLLFTHTGGKDRLPTAISALRAVKVDVQVVADFDVLADHVLLQQIIETLGGNWSDIERQWMIVRSAVNQLREAPLRSVVESRLQEGVSEVKGERLTQADSDRLRSILKVDSGWAQVKRGGVATLPQGEPSVAAAELLTVLSTIGLHVVPVGELERWNPRTPSKSTKWVAAALEARLHEERGPHADFIKRVADSVSG